MPSAAALANFSCSLWSFSNPLTAFETSAVTLMPTWADSSPATVSLSLCPLANLSENVRSVGVVDDCEGLNPLAQHRVGVRVHCVPIAGHEGPVRDHDR